MAPRPFVRLPSGAQVELYFDVAGSPANCRLWFVRRTSEPDSTNIQELVDGLWDLYSTQIVPFLSDQLTLVQILGIDWTSEGNPQVGTSFIGVPGSNTSGCHSANVAVKVIFSASQPPRNFKNWNFLPGIPLDAINGNDVDGAFASAIRDGYVNIIDAASVWGTFPAWRWVCTSQAHNNTPRTFQLQHAASLISVAPTARQCRRRLTP